jgi:hypothetical protein
MKLTKGEDNYKFTDGKISVSLDLVDFHIINTAKLTSENTEITLKKAAEMKVLIDSVKGIREQ